jgi:hypothetical protein
MRDDQKRALLADGGKGEAVAHPDAEGVCADGTRFSLFECAPREAQPVTEILRLLSKMHDECGTNAGQDALWDAHEAVEQLFAAPTPERADAKKDAALTNEKIEAAIEAWFDTDGKDVDDHQSRMRAAILAANKEPERAQESAAVQDAIEDVAKYFEDCGDPYGAKMIRKYAFNKLAVAKEPQP